MSNILQKNDTEAGKTSQCWIPDQEIATPGIVLYINQSTCLLRYKQLKMVKFVWQDETWSEFALKRFIGNVYNIIFNVMHFLFQLCITLFLMLYTFHGKCV